MKRLARLILVAAALFPFIAQAQSERKVHKVGYLSVRSPVNASIANPLLEHLKNTGYVRGENLIFEERFAEGNPQRLGGLAADLVSRKVDVIVASATQAAQAAQRATSTIPVVFFAVVDPTASGLVTNLRHPGKNVTGIGIRSTELSAKRLEVLQQILPKATKVGVLWNASNPSYESQLTEITRVAKSRGIELRSVAVRQATDIDGVFAGSVVSGIDALLAVDDPMVVRERARIASLARSHRMPTISGFTTLAEAGFLVSYGPDLADQFRGAASYVHRILQGARPGDLPVELPTRFHLVINMKTARELNIEIPQAVLLRADQIIE